MTTRRPSRADIEWVHRLHAALKAEQQREALRQGIASAVLMLAGILGAGGLLYFRVEIWAWAAGDPVTFAVVLVALTVGSLFTIRAARERRH